MYKNVEEIFTSDLKYREEIVSIDDETMPEIEEHCIESGVSFEREELDLVWDTLRDMMPCNHTKFIHMYLIYYIGLSYRDAAAVTGSALSWCHDSVEKTVANLKTELCKRGKLTAK